MSDSAGSEPESDPFGAGQFAERLASARDGDETKLGQILDTYRDYLLLIANHEVPSNVRPKAAPSDLVQDTFIDAKKSLKDFQGSTPEQLRAWLRSILLHNVADTTKQYCGTRKRRVDLEVPLGDGSASGFRVELADDGSSPSHHAVMVEQVEHIMAALNQLAPESRQVIRLRNIEDRSFVEIAEQMNRSRQSVSRLWSQAMVELGALLEKNHEFP